ncbi:transcriptional regulator [Leptolyngbya sp. Heron Island J]|uniref:response regulator transcription factor n=1 Tax=Leptolyngbya sp. Heron Island J TaxID=1385935 RepID=UPI0003B969C2|nr:response regulator transcription factor [Leptolyngbya sp. Heron Island J]ESA33581.1 transcriptional regulator [Leptolyngbya sp. Heron Island J]
MNRILIAEDNPHIIDFLKAGLKAHGFTVLVVEKGERVAEFAHSSDFDLLILDLGLPGKDGLAILRELRGQGELLPIIVLTARDGVDDTVMALEGGANDYITKPFRFEELLARIRVQLRDRSGNQQLTSETLLRVGDLSLDLLTRQARVGDRVVELSAREFVLAEVLLRHPMQVMSKEQLLNRVWGYDYDPGSNIIEVYIRHLRKKLGRDYIETVRGMGYRLQSRNSP